jgi:hypothetical protein
VNIRDISLHLARRHCSRMWPEPGDPLIQSPDGDSGHTITHLFKPLVAEAVEHGLDDDRIAISLSRLHKRPRRYWPSACEQMRRACWGIRRGFEERLQQRGGPALDLYECVRVCCLEAGEDFVKRSSPQADCRRPDGPDPKLAALTLRTRGPVWWLPRYRACSAPVMPLGPKPAGWARLQGVQPVAHQVGRGLRRTYIICPGTVTRWMLPQ